MAKCKQCSKEYEAKRSTSSYCSPKCKQEFYRNRMKGVTVTPVTLSNAKPVTVTDTLRTKAESLQHKSGTDTMSVKDGKDTEYQMTVMERLFYRSKLKPGQTNFVSLPGRACYGVV